MTTAKYSKFLHVIETKELDKSAAKGPQTPGSSSQMLQSKHTRTPPLQRALLEHQLCVFRLTVQPSSRNTPQNTLYNHLCSPVTHDGAALRGSVYSGYNRHVSSQHRALGAAGTVQGRREGKGSSAGHSPPHESAATSGYRPRPCAWGEQNV